MTSSVQPLLTLSQARIQEELWSAELTATAAAAYGRKNRRLVRICAVAGLVVLGLSLWIASSALAQVVFYGAFFVRFADQYGRVSSRPGLRRGDEKAAA